MEQQTFVQHYVDYLFTSKGILSILIAFPILLYVHNEIRNPQRHFSTNAIRGCFRIGLRTRSNLQDQYDAEDHNNSRVPRVKAIYVYPVKSCRGIELPASEVSGTGLRYDRMFSFAQQVERGSDGDHGQRGKQWRFITQREYPKLALLATELWIPDPRREEAKKQRPSRSSPYPRASGQIGSEDWARQGGCLIIRFPNETARTEFVTLRIPLVPTPQRVHQKKYTSEPMAIWRDVPMSTNITAEIETDSLVKLELFLGMKNPLGLFRVDFDNLRGISRSLPKNRRDEQFNVGFADAFPVHILSIASVREVDTQLPNDASVKDELDAVRFRANVYVDGVPASAEDKWMRIAIGRAVTRSGHVEAAEYHVACRTARCTLPNVHPETGVKDRNEPHATLKRTRQVDEGAKPHPCLGLSMIPLFSHGVIRVGDKIDVLETGEHYYEKMFS